jgi:hypothetical protein
MNDALSRREFGVRAISGFTLFALADTIFGKDAFASSFRPVGEHWLSQLDQLGRDCKDQKLKQVEWQKLVEELYSKVDLPDFLKLIDFEKVRKQAADYKGPGAKSLMVNFPQIEGIPTKLSFGRQIFAMKKDRSVVPHGHDNMATAFLMLKGDCRGRHYERVADEKAHLIVAPTIDKTFGPGGTSTISDQKDNVHWFQALTDDAFIFNIHLMGVTKGGKTPGRVYIDPNGEKIEGGKIRARLIDHVEADKLYG